MSFSTCTFRHMDAAAELSPTKRRWLLAAVMSGLLLAMLDQSIVGTALPRIVESLGGSSLYVWVATAYLVTALYSGRRNAALQGALAGLMGIAFIAGPLVGGFLTDHVGWRSVFMVNLPIGIAALAIVATVLPASVGRSERRGTPLDLTGIALLTLGVGLLLIGLNERHAVLIAGGFAVIAGF